MGGGVPVLEGDGMKGDEEPRPRFGQPELPGQRRTGQRLRGGEAVEAGCAHGVDAPRLLPHGGDAPGVGLRRGEVQMGELGDGMANLVVHRPFGDLAAVDVRHGQREWERGHRRREHLEAVAQDHDHIRA